MPISLEGDAWQTYLSFVFIDDDAFTDWARNIGVDPAPVLHGDVAGIGVRNTLGNDGTTYRHDETFATTGTMAALTHATYREATTRESSPTGKPSARSSRRRTAKGSRST